MTMEKNSQLGQGGNGFQGDGPGTAAAMIKELQGLKRVFVAGAAANTNMAVAGIATNDTIQSAVSWASGVPTDRTGTVTITSAGNVQCSAALTSATLELWYYDKN